MPDICARCGKGIFALWKWFASLVYWFGIDNAVAIKALFSTYAGVAGEIENPPNRVIGLAGF
jgi:hypothetical protein